MNSTCLKTSLPILITTLLFIGCGKKEAATATPASSGGASILPSSSAKTTVAVPGQTNVAAPGFFLFVSQNEERQDPQDSTSEVPILRKHRIILACTDLPTNRTYELTWRLIGPDGKDWPLVKPQYVFTTIQPSINAWFSYNPPEKPPKAGAWRWEVSILDGQTFRREFTMTPPSPDEMAQLARYEKARETVFRAFAHRWLGHDGFYFGTVGDGLSQLGGLSYRSKTDYVSTADLMNGITYKGRVAFSFQTFRLFGSEERWNDWQDTVEYRNSFSEFMGENFPGNLPVRFQKGFDMNFTIQERDGHWRVWSDTGAIYLNSRVIKNSFAPQPSPSAVIQALNGGSSRKDSAAQGETIRNTPYPSESGINKTMDQLRGRSL